MEIVSPPSAADQLLQAYSDTLPKALPVSNSAKKAMGMRRSAVTQTVMAPDAILPHMVIEDSGLPNETLLPKPSPPPRSQVSVRVLIGREAKMCCFLAPPCGHTWILYFPPNHNGRLHFQHFPASSLSSGS